VRLGPGEEFSADSTISCNGTVVNVVRYLLALIFIGLGVEWLLRPDDTVYLGIEFVVSYRVTISTDFYERFTNLSYFGSRK